MMRRLIKFGREDKAAVSPMMVLMLVPLIGILSMAGEAGFWFMAQRDLQNAADSSALAAAANDGATYADEAKSVAGVYGYPDIADNIDVAPSNIMCPGATTGTNCYRVEITRVVPRYLTQIVGFAGDGQLSDGRMGKKVVAVAIARKRKPGNAFCLTALGFGSKDGIEFNGASNASTPGCDYLSNTPIICNGSSTPAESAWYVGPKAGSNKTCADSYADDHVITDPVCDPFHDCATRTRTLDDLIPPENNSPADCAGSPKYPHTAKAANTITTSWTGVKKVCGSAFISGAVNLTGDATLVIYNGGLSVPNGAKLTTSGSGGLTVVFAKGATVDPSPVAPGFDLKGTVDYASPKTGNYAGVAVHIDRDYPPVKGKAEAKIAGGSTFNLTGLVYAPAHHIEVAGAINKASSGLNCMAIVSKAITISGTGEIYNNATSGSPGSECNLAGLVDAPKLPDTRQVLVQ